MINKVNFQAANVFVKAKLKKEISFASYYAISQTLRKKYKYSKFQIEKK